MADLPPPCDLQRPLLQHLQLDWLERAGVEAAMLRLDRVDAQLSGNKWFKLVHHLEAARSAEAPGLISLGGAHSNHLHALAAAGRRFGFATVGLLRGHAQQTPTVADLQAAGMQLHWLGYGGYRARHLAGFWTPWLERYPGYYCIAEGGGGLRGALGCVPLITLLQAQLPRVGWDAYDAIWLAAGTGTTLAGLLIGDRGRHQLYGALAGPPSHAVEDNVAGLLAEAGIARRNYRLLDASRKGFGRIDPQLAEFMTATEQASGILLDPVYTGKALLALRESVEQGLFAAGTRLVVVHTGGLQGRRAAQALWQRPAG